MKMMKTEMEFVAFDAQDVIATSGELTVTLAGMYDKVKDNATIKLSDGNVIYDASKDYSIVGAVTALNNALNVTTITSDTLFYCTQSKCKTLNNLLSHSPMCGDNGTATNSDDYNKVYKWISDQGYFLYQ